MNAASVDGSEGDGADLRVAAWHALRGVYDPEIGLDLVSLGLVYDVRLDDGRVVVEMTLTTPGCPAAESMPEVARLAVEEETGGEVPVEVRLVWEPPWDVTMMSEDALASLRRGRW